MMRIVALNENSQKEENDEDDTQVTKEAEETIAVSEYMRALSLKQKNKQDLALNLLKELLETHVLHEVSRDNKQDKLFSVKYNCYKNIALIYEEKDEKQLALEHFVQAMELDDTEVYAMNRLGQLALKLKHLELAQYAFQKCLAQNPNHWPSADGVLQVLCLTENIIEAYGWALKWYRRDDNYERAIDVLTEIDEKFHNLIPFFESVWKDSYKPDKNKNRIKKTDSVFPQHEIIDTVEYMVKPNLEDFRQNVLTWQSVGNFIINVYKHCIETKQSIIFIFTVDDMLQKQQEPKRDESEAVKVEEETTEVIDVDMGSSDNIDGVTACADNPPEIDTAVFVAPSSDATGNQTPLQSDSNAEDSDKADTDAAAKPKPRRRCSDLSFLEQWGWHKNRRYSSRKKSQQDRNEIDSTLNGFLRRIFAKHFDENFDNHSPFLADVKVNEESKDKTMSAAEICATKASYDHFQSVTENDFLLFLTELKSQNFDLILIIFLWLKYVSKYWEMPITEEMRDIYHQIYLFYLSHYDLCTWNHLSNDDFNAAFRMTLFFLELDMEKVVTKTDGETRKEAESQWKMLYHHLMFNTGNAFVISDDIYEKNIIRLVWTDYCSAKHENDLNQCVEALMGLEELIKKQGHDFNLFHPNLKENNFLDLETIKTTRINLQRKISLSNVKTLYDNNKFGDLVEILKDSLVNSTEIKNSDNTVMKIQTQFEVLLESLWNLEKFEECLIWSERCLKFAVDNLLPAPTDTYRYREWAESVNFILIYIEELILKQGYDIVLCLEKFLSRLVQSLAKILTHQFDSPFDKNNNPAHPVNTKRSWVILHQLLQRDEDNSPVVVKTRSLENTAEIEDLEELLPHPLLILFTAHEFLGRRFWCTKDNGQLLLYTIDTIAPKLRAPLIDPYRDHVAEYLEQITYCLYGYPPKKARSRHIEEHDASPVDLTWQRAITLFDVYRPENLPEFNSYKLDSISADMEQLLLKILPLVPKEIDPSSLTSNIRDFISGTTDELPQECALLPHRISCIYYLLADYYFKNRDFSKTIKFYVLDLTLEPTRFDSWAGLALSKASKLETKLNSCTLLNEKEFLAQSEDAVRCFDQCIKLNRTHTLLWIEYGSFAYTIHAFCSRNLKQSSDMLSMEQFEFVEAKKDRYLKIAHDCFSTAEKNINTHTEDVPNEDNDSHDEKWLHHFMLGKIAEKQKEHPKVFLDHYLQAANFLYENNATYPIKINHNNPSNLSVEALEIFYRTTSAIVKYLEQHVEISREIGRLFTQVLKDLSSSPFAYNQAKIDDSSINALKRKLAEKAEATGIKQQKLEIVETGSYNPNKIEERILNKQQLTESAEQVKIEPPQPVIQIKQDKSRSQTPNIVVESKPTSPSRRGSQESTVTTTTSTTGTGTGTTSSASSSSGSDSSSSDSSSSDSESGSGSDEEAEKPDENTPFSESELEPIYRACVKNLEECVTRFSEHYKSVYRLVNHYLHAPEKLKDLEKCRQLLLGTYTTGLGNQIVGLFSDRKNNNFFNGIWRIPSSEIDRPGSFSSHLTKCVVILLEVLKKSGDYRTLIDLAILMYRVPDNDKRYIKEVERKELYQQAISFCVQILRDQVKKHSDKKDDAELLNLLIDIYKTHKKCLKHILQKEAQFTNLLTDAYKLYVQDKVAKIPETANVVDLAIKLCLQEISVRKNQDKLNLVNAQVHTQGQIVLQPGITPSACDVPSTNLPKSTTIIPTIVPTQPPPPPKPVQIPGISSRPRGRPVGSKNSNSAASIAQNLQASLNSMTDPATLSALMSLYGSPANTPNLMKDKTYMNNLITEYYKLLSSPAMAGSLSTFLANPTLLTAALPKPSAATGVASLQKPQPSLTPPIGNQSTKIPQFDIKNLIASAASQVAKSTTITQAPSATISIGSGQLTITPTTTKSSISAPKETKASTSISMSSKIFQSMPKASSSVSVTKVPVGSPSLTVKTIPELNASKLISPSQLATLPELPKSLTITPAPSLATDKTPKLPSQPNLPQISMFPEIPMNLDKVDKYGGKMKASKKSSMNPSPYARMPSTSTSTFPGSVAANAQLGNLSMGQQMPFPGGFNLQNYNQQVNLLNTYADLLKNMGMAGNPALLSQLSQFPLPQQKKAYTRKPRTPKNPQNRFPNPMSVLRNPDIPAQMHTAGSASASILKTSKGQSFAPSYNMPISSSPISKSPILAPSQSPSPNLPPASVIPLPSVTPPLTVQSSPTKTLQQKLAERQKANALNEKVKPSSSSSGSKKKDPDVIILD